MKKIVRNVLFSLVSLAFTGCTLNSLDYPILTGDYEQYKDWPEDYGDALIAAWDNDKVGAFAITIDDNHGQDVSWWLERGAEYDLPFTWFLIPTRVESSSQPVGGTWDLYNDVFDAGHDIQSHTYSHLNEYAAGITTIDQEYEWGISEIETHISGQEVETVAHVGGDNSVLNDIALSETYYVGGRGNVGQINDMSFDYSDTKSFSSTADIFDRNSLFSYAPRILDPDDEEKYRGFVCVYFHGINLGSSSEIYERKKWAERTFGFLNANSSLIWTGKFKDIVKYAKERDSVIAADGLSTLISDDEIQIGLSSGGTLDAVYDHPLVIKVKLDETWTNPMATQGGIPIEVEVKQYDGEYYVFVKAIPDGGEILLEKQPAVAFSYSVFLL